MSEVSAEASRRLRFIPVISRSFLEFMTLVLFIDHFIRTFWHCWLGSMKGIRLVKRHASAITREDSLLQGNWD